MKHHDEKQARDVIVDRTIARLREALAKLPAEHWEAVGNEVRTPDKALVCTAQGAIQRSAYIGACSPADMTLLLDELERLRGLAPPPVNNSPSEPQIPGAEVYVSVPKGSW